VWWADPLGIKIKHHFIRSESRGGSNNPKKQNPQDSTAVRLYELQSSASPFNHEQKAL